MNIKQPAPSADSYLAAIAAIIDRFRKAAGEVPPATRAALHAAALADLQALTPPVTYGDAMRWLKATRYAP
jgi:hypothetical protein